MKRNKQRISLTLRAYKNGEMAHRADTRSFGRFTYHVQASENLGCDEYYLRAYYGTKKDVFGDMVKFTNEGTYNNVSDLLHAYRAFTEPESNYLGA